MREQHPAREQLALFAAGDSEAQERVRVERHCATCETCRLEVQRFAAVRRRLVEAGKQEAAVGGDSVRAAVMQRVMESKSSRVDRRWWILLMPALAAGLGLLSVRMEIPRAKPSVLEEGRLPSMVALRRLEPMLLPEPLRMVEQRRPARRASFAGVRALSYIARADGPGMLQMTTGDPNVVVLVPLREGKETYAK